ncbi:hypothetical protein [Phreatobacter sp.]|uniref:hypothetical protein n=1 Tax=Phreatobacter sp. TaxID=1966341 RepID=UPI0022C0AA13|nr:hypothetical protein [Phreatobacter sp.]MCZ8314799.1 hypothetical protein [Phreatobacter sp.]
MLKAKRDTDPQPTPVKLDGLTDEAPRRGLSTLMVWAGVALFLVGAAVLGARSETGSQRIARLFAPTPPPVQLARAEPPRPASTDTLLLYETRRLADQVRVLNAEREALADRLASVERSVGDVTASIPRAEATRAEPPRIEPARPDPVPPQRAVRVIPTAPPVADPLPAATAAPATAPVPTPSPAPVQAVQTPPPAPPVPAPTTQGPEAQDSTAIRTEFGVDLAGEQSIEALRSRWQQLRAQHGPVLEGLRPVVAIQEGARPGATVELRLVAGPLSNANAAARLCATLSLAGLNCKPTVFDGQRLALR